MDNNTLQLKVKLRLNKLASNDYDNIECWQIAEAFNKAQLQFMRRAVRGLVGTQRGDESNKLSIDDISDFIVPNKKIEPERVDNRYVVIPEPKDFLYTKSITPIAKSDCCGSKDLVCYPIRTSDVDLRYEDHLTEPSFEWAETFYTNMDKKFFVYKKNFDILHVEATYYRKPKNIEIMGCVRTSDGSIITQDVESEFSDDVVELLIEEAAMILAKDIENPNIYQAAQIETNKNT